MLISSLPLSPALNDDGFVVAWQSEDQDGSGYGVYGQRYGAGGNAVNNMIRAQLEGVDFVVANTDAQSLVQSGTERRIQLGARLTAGLGAGSRPDVGRGAAEESIDEIVADDQLLDRAVAVAKEYAGNPPMAYAAIKHQIRAEALANMQSAVDNKTDATRSGWFTDETMVAMDAILAATSAKK